MIVSVLHRCLAVLVGLVLLLLVGRALPGTSGLAAADKKLAPGAPPAPARAPAGKSTAEPRVYTFTPDEYWELLDEIDQLRKQIKELRATLERSRTTLPSKCSLKGKVEGNLVILQAQFEFFTEQPRSLINLGCTQALATGVSLDGTVPPVLGGGSGEPGGRSSGFSVVVEKPGKHDLTLDLALALTTSAGLHRIVLDLPRSAITRVDLDLPAGAREVRLGGKPLIDPLQKFEKNHLSGTLGPVSALDLTWKPNRPVPGGGASVRSVEGLVQVRLDMREVITEARFTLGVTGTPVKEWTLVVPLKAELRVVSGGGDSDPVARTDRFDQRDVSVRTLHLKELSADPLTVHVQVRTPRPRPGSRIPIGPFEVLRATTQSGNLLVSNSVPNLHLAFQPHRDLRQRAITEKERKDNPSLLAATMAQPRLAPGPSRKPRAKNRWPAPAAGFPGSTSKPKPCAVRCAHA
jgi:hypothetical protein